MVDDRLRQLAAAFSTAAQRQAKVLSGQADDAAISSAAYELAEAKKAFWKAQNGARSKGYKVQGSMRAYLPAEPVAVA